MAVNFLNNLDLNGNQLLNARLQVLASDPGSAAAGDIIYNSSSNVLKFYNGSAWVDPSAGSYTSWDLSGNSGTGSIVNNSNVTISGGTGITTALVNPTGTIFVVTANLDEATSTTRGGIELFSDTGQSVAANSVSTTAGRTYGIQLNSSGQAVVNVPWTDANIELNFDASDGSSSQVANNGTMTFAQGTGITTTGDDNGTITITNSKPFDGLTLASTSGSNSTIANSGTITLAAGAGITTTNNGTGQVTIAATGSGLMSSFTLAGDSGSNQTISDGNTVTLAGGTNITTAASATDTVTINSSTYAIDALAAIGTDAVIKLTCTPGTNSEIGLNGTSNEIEVSPPQAGSSDITFSLPTNVTIPGDLTVGGGDITLSGTGRIQGVDTVTDGTDAVNKTYVDNAVVGNLVFQGGYNASTNSPDLDSSPSSSIKKGWAYVVTVAGNFFTEKVEVGDFLFAQSDAPTELVDWVTVQNNVGLATASSVGIGNVVASTDAASLGVNVSYSSGTATVGWAIKNLTTISNAIVDTDLMAILDQSTNEQKRIALSTLKTYFQAGLSQGFAGTSSSGTTHTFNHNLNTYDVIVQVYDASNYETVYASVDRTSVNQVVVTTAASANIRCLINNVG